MKIFKTPKNPKINNIILLILAFISAIIAWGWITIVQSPIETVVIPDVPVVLNVPQEYQDSDYQIYGNSTFSVDVTISGKRFVVQEITASDITASATVSEKISSGVKSLNIDVQAKESGVSKYTIESLSKNSISVFFDKPETREFPVSIDVKTQSADLADNLKIGKAIPSDQTVKVTGPSTELDKITEVTASVNLSGKITESKKYTPSFSLKGEDSDVEFKYSEIENNETFTVYVYLMIQKELPFNIAVGNIPNNKQMKCTFSQPTAKFWIIMDGTQDEVTEVVVTALAYENLKDINYMKIDPEKLKYELAEELENPNYIIEFQDKNN